MTMGSSSSVELDVLSVDAGDSPAQPPQNEELVEVLS